jgi:nucleoside-diphosphate-sugar epimerase
MREQIMNEGQTKIIITGALGSCGAALTQYFAARGYRVLASGRDEKPPAELLKIAEYFQADITRPFIFPEADVCIHTAAYSDDKAAYKDLYLPNVIGTKNVTNAAVHCKRFIHISSSSVYIPDANPISEEMAGRQKGVKLSSYGQSKLGSERMFAETYKNNSAFILRPRAFYGAGDRVILPRILKLVKNEVFNRPGPMNVRVSLTHYDNLAEAVERCISSEKTGINIYNVSDDKVYVFSEVIRRLVQELYGHQLPEKEMSIVLLRLLAILRVGGLTPLLVRSFTKDMVLNISKIKTELNYLGQADFYLKLKEVGDWVKHIGGVEAIKAGRREFAWM